MPVIEQVRLQAANPFLACGDHSHARISMHLSVHPVIELNIRPRRSQDAGSMNPVGVEVFDDRCPDQERYQLPGCSIDRRYSR